MALADDLDRAAAAAGALAPPGKLLGAVLPAEPGPGARRYVCAFEDDAGGRAWLVLDGTGAPLRDRRDVRDAVALAALCEIACEAAAGGDLDELLAQLVALRVTEAPAGIAEAEDAVRALQRVIGSPPELATPSRLDAIGEAARQLELALDGAASASPFTAAMRSAQTVVEALLAEIEAAYLGPLV